MYTYFVSYRYYYEDQQGFGRLTLTRENPIQCLSDIESIEKAINRGTVILLNYALLSHIQVVYSHTEPPGENDGTVNP